MGKVADNEKLKLRALFYNNLAAGAVVGGAILPFVNFYEQHLSLIEFFTKETAYHVGQVLLPIGLALVAAGWARGRANKFISRLID
ncbi:MAG: hypothetical protein ACREB8_10650 [Pseudolabrys sp.]